MPSDKCNSTIARAMGLIFTIQHRFGLRGAFWHTYNAFSMDLPVSSLIFADSEKCQFGDSTWWLLFVVEKIVHNFHGGYFDCGGAFQSVVDLYCCVTG